MHSVLHVYIIQYITTAVVVVDHEQRERVKKVIIIGRVFVRVLAPLSRI